MPDPTRVDEVRRDDAAIERSRAGDLPVPEGALADALREWVQR